MSVGSTISRGKDNKKMICNEIINIKNVFIFILLFRTQELIKENSITLKLLFRGKWRN